MQRNKRPRNNWSVFYDMMGKLHVISWMLYMLPVWVVGKMKSNSAFCKLWIPFAHPQLDRQVFAGKLVCVLSVIWIPLQTNMGCSYFPLFILLFCRAFSCFLSLHLSTLELAYDLYSFFTFLFPVFLSHLIFSFILFLLFLLLLFSYFAL